VSDHLLGQVRIGRRSACLSGMVALIAGLGLILTACGSSAGTATASVTRLSSSCIPPAFRLSGPRPAPAKRLTTPLDTAILSNFAIFRRSAFPSDALAELKPRGDGLDRELSKVYELSGYYPAYVRQLTRLPDGRRYFVIPAYGRAEAVLPAHCLPAGERERRLLVEEQHRRLVEPVDCIIEVGGSENEPPLGCEPFDAIDEAGRVFEPDLYKELIVELVPDGVASVRIAYRETPPIDVPVSENAVWFTPPPPAPRVKAELKRLEPSIFARHLTRVQRRRFTMQWDAAVRETEPTTIEWLDNTGELVRTINPPTAASSSVTSVGNLRAPIEG
jgi:hypothetical protein